MVGRAGSLPSTREQVMHSQLQNSQRFSRRYAYFDKYRFGQGNTETAGDLRLRSQPYDKAPVPNAEQMRTIDAMPNESV